MAARNDIALDIAYVKETSTRALVSTFFLGFFFHARFSYYSIPIAMVTAWDVWFVNYQSILLSSGKEIKKGGSNYSAKNVELVVARWRC